MRYTCLKFQSTLPARGATLVDALNARGWTQFQSTLPARGATDLARPFVVNPAISIHAPRTGSDRCKIAQTQRQAHFNPRSPHGERLDVLAQLLTYQPISIHAPRTGSDPTEHCTIWALQISIHAPRTGSDVGESVTFTVTQKFQSTLPARGATLLLIVGMRHEKFQSTLPARGATATRRNHFRQ